MSESGGQSILQCNSRLANGELDKDKGHGFIGSRSEQNVTDGTDLTNIPLTPHDKVSVLSVLKSNDGLVSPVPDTPWFSPPVCSSASKVMGISNMSLSYFTDPTVSNENEAKEPAEISLTNSDKYFSTPMPSKERIKKKLTPVLEVDFEDNMSEEWQPQDKVSRKYVLLEDCADVSSHESPMKTPLYRSFFAAECQEIVDQIKNVETVVKSTPGKRKVEEFDVSTIDAEPLPFDYTPMKSMQACEVANVLRSLESSPVKEGVSLFGESLLDLSAMQLNDFNLPECVFKNGKGLSVSNPKGLSLSNGQEVVCVKRQKTESFEKNYCGVNNLNEMSPLPNVLKSLTPETSAMESSHTYTANKCIGGINAVTANNVSHTEPKLSDSLTEPGLRQGMTVPRSVNQMVKASVQSLGSTTKTSALGYERTTTCIGQLSETDEHKECMSTTQDIVLNCSNLSSTGITHVIEENQVYTNTQLNITSEEVNAANIIQVIEILPLISNTTQEISYIQEETDVAKITQVIDMVVPSGRTIQDITYMMDDTTPADTTRVIDFVPLSANTTKDITPTQIIEEGPQLPTNTTKDLPSMHESKIASRTLDLSCLNATKDISSVHGAVLTANVSEVIEFATLILDNTTPDERIAANRTQDVKVVQKSSVEVSSGEAIPTSFTDAVTKEFCNPKEICDSPHHEAMPTIPDHSIRNVTQPSVNLALEVPAQPGISTDSISLPGTKGTEPEISTSNSVCNLNAENKMDFTKLNDKKVSKLDAQENMASSEKVDVCKESSQPLHSESCSMIQEEENANDVSVFSVGSLSFVTSTPVPGLNNFQFQKTSRDSVQQDSNMSIGSVFDYSANKMPGEQRSITQHGSQKAPGLNCNDKGKQISRGILPTSIQRSLVPPSEAVPKAIPSTSGIPSARRSLALHQNSSPNPVSKTVPRGISGRGFIRPPIGRQSLPRASLGSQKQAMETTGGSNITNKFTGSKFKSQKAAAASAVVVPKARSTTTHTQLPTGASSAKPPSRLGALTATGRLSVGGQNTVANQHSTPSRETISVVRPTISAGMRTGLPRPGTSSIRPPLPQTQKVSPKLKPHVQGLATKKNQRELPTFGFRRENSSKAESTSVARSTAKQATLALDITKDTTSHSVVRGNTNSSLARGKVENPNEVHSALPPKETARIPTIATGVPESGHESCEHLQTCNCCHVRYNKLLKENEELKRRLGEVQHAEVALNRVTAT